MKRSPKILILGGGFAGVEVVRELEKLLTPDEAILQLVSRDNFVLFTPMLHGNCSERSRHLGNCEPYSQDD